MRAYIASPLSTEDNRNKAEKIDKICKELDIETFLPHRDIGLHIRKESSSKRFFNRDIEELDKCQVVIAILDASEGTSWEIGYAYAKKIPIIAILGKVFMKNPEEVNLMLSNSVEIVDSLDKLKIKLEELKSSI